MRFVAIDSQCFSEKMKSTLQDSATALEIAERPYCCNPSALFQRDPSCHLLLFPWPSHLSQLSSATYPLYPSASTEMTLWQEVRPFCVRNTPAQRNGPKPFTIGSACRNVLPAAEQQTTWTTGSNNRNEPDAGENQHFRFLRRAKNSMMPRHAAAPGLGRSGPRVGRLMGCRRRIKGAYFLWPAESGKGPATAGSSRDVKAFACC